MGQDEDYNKDFTDKSSALSEDEIEKNDDWLNEHGQPDFEYLQSLVAEGSLEALEKLKSIAEDLNVDYDPNISTEELIEKIRATVDQNEDEGPGITA